MTTILLEITDHQYWRMVIHKALLHCENWDEYLLKILNYPMKKLEYGEDPYPKPKTGRIRKLTIRLCSDIEVAAKDTKNRLNRTWRQLILEPSDKDGVDIFFQDWLHNSRFDGSDVFNAKA